MFCRLQWFQPPPILQQPSRLPLRPAVRQIPSVGRRRQYHPTISLYYDAGAGRTAPQLEEMPPPLKGIRILDLTRVLAGPTATMLLGDLGADVIKVEEVRNGDDTRSWNPPSAPLLPTPDQPEETSHLPPESAYFLAVNRNKRSITVNFKHPEGKEILHRLIKTSDVLVENFVAGKLASMGLGYEDCRKLNERLIYASITGYGQTGPYREAAGYDVIIEAEAGLMHITGEPDGSPCKVGVAATDIATGLYAHGAIMAALLSRQKTGKGVWIDCNLFETQVSVSCTYHVFRSVYIRPPKTLVSPSPGRTGRTEITIHRTDWPVSCKVNFHKQPFARHQLRHRLLAPVLPSRRRPKRATHKLPTKSLPKGFENV
ncbi:hypothetical protein AX16_008419 [Volvariella volvacea WC 439]|nr:hypothetical protein AX16_008419 [Volvariella volvacea WC 439]